MPTNTATPDVCHFNKLPTELHIAIFEMVLEDHRPEWHDPQTRASLKRPGLLSVRKCWRRSAMKLSVNRVLAPPKQVRASFEAAMVMFKAELDGVRMNPDVQEEDKLDAFNDTTLSKLAADMMVADVEFEDTCNMFKCEEARYKR